MVKNYDTRRKRFIVKRPLRKTAVWCKSRNVRNNFDISYFDNNVKGIKILIEEYSVKSYLRPMSSMTEEEIEECYQIQQNTIHVTFYKYDEGYEKTIDLPYFESLVDFYNSHHLDFRGLIPMGLAIEAPKDMYNFK